MTLYFPGPGHEDERPFKNYPQKLRIQRQKSYESHLSLTLMRVKLVLIHVQPDLIYENV